MSKQCVLFMEQDLQKTCLQSNFVVFPAIGRAQRGHFVGAAAAVAASSEEASSSVSLLTRVAKVFAADRVATSVLVIGICLWGECLFLFFFTSIYTLGRLAPLPPCHDGGIGHTWLSLFQSTPRQRLLRQTAARMERRLFTSLRARIFDAVVGNSVDVCRRIDDRSRRAIDRSPIF